jgi:hypothetical protein
VLFTLLRSICSVFVATWLMGSSHSQQDLVR